jgi:hypothetical protein
MGFTNRLDGAHDVDNDSTHHRGVLSCDPEVPRLKTPFADGGCAISPASLACFRSFAQHDVTKSTATARLYLDSILVLPCNPKTGTIDGPVSPKAVGVPRESLYRLQPEKDHSIRNPSCSTRDQRSVDPAIHAHRTIAKHRKA